MSGFGALAYALPEIYSQTQKLIGRMAITPTPTRIWQIDQLIRGLVQAGIWWKLDAMWVCAAHTEQAALLNWINPGVTFTAVNNGSTTFTPNVGFTGNGSSMYISTTFVPSTAGGLYLQDSGSLFGWSNVSAADAQPLIGTSGTQQTNKIYHRFTGDFLTAAVNCATSAQQIAVTNTDGKGFYQVTRTGAAALGLYKNGVSVATDTDASAALTADTIYLLRFDAGFSSTQVLCAGIGSGMVDSEAALLYFHMHNYMQNVAGLA